MSEVETACIMVSALETSHTYDCITSVSAKCIHCRAATVANSYSTGYNTFSANDRTIMKYQNSGNTRNQYRRTKASHIQVSNYVAHTCTSATVQSNSVSSHNRMQTQTGAQMRRHRKLRAKACAMTYSCGRHDRTHSTVHSTHLHTPHDRT
jgi:hypothetical protein